MRSILAVLVVCLASGASVAVGQECVSCREFNQVQVLSPLTLTLSPTKRGGEGTRVPTLAPVLPAVASGVKRVASVPVRVANVSVRVAAVPVRLVVSVPQVVKQMPVVKHVGHGHLVSILERPVGIVRRTVSVPVQAVQRLSHKARFGCR